MSIPMRIPEGKIILTYDDYVELPNDGKRYEILEGELAVTPAPALKHQISAAKVFKIVSRHVDENKLGIVLFAPVDLILDSSSILQPDLLFVSNARQNILTEKGLFSAPDLVIEILSPTTTRNDRVTKAQIYARHKVPAYWIADPEQETLEIYLLDGDSFRLVATLQGDTLMSVPPFTDLKFAAKDIFI